jgi:glutamyl-tRNA synthetase
MTDQRVRTRIAPSPTGIPHIGNTRTALFDYLLAKKYGGDFILRIEDTDQDRFVEGATEKIYKIHDVLGLIPDEDPRVGGKFGPYIQTERLEIYKKYAQELINVGAAYYCFCSEERLADLHKSNPYAKYDRHCRNLSPEEIKEKLDAKTPFVIRCKLPETGFTTWHDLVQGKLSLPNTECDDKVLLKTSGIPTYHLAVVVDDHLMEITHALRGVEWMMSTPIHIFLFEALGWKPPILAHVPLLLGPDKSKLSKRHGAKSVLEYIDEGFLPEAINNFIFYLGFSYKDNSSLLTLTEMSEIFDETRLQKQNCIFDIEKLKYTNSQWIKKLDIDTLYLRLKPFLSEDWRLEIDKIKSIIPLVRDHMVLLGDFTVASSYFFEEIKVTKEDVLKQSAHSESETATWLLIVVTALEKMNNDVSAEDIQTTLQELQKTSGLSPREAFMSLRVALSGRTVTPHIFDCIKVLGLKKSIERLKSIF